MVERNGDIGEWIEEEASGGGLAVLGWGFGAVVTFVLAFASWQYAPSRPAPGALARTEIGQPDPSEITGSIAATDGATTSVLPSRTIGLGRVAPMPLAGHETVATSRDLDRLRAEIAEIRRRIQQIGMAGDGVSRRLDGIEERISSVRGPVDAATSPAVAGTPTGASGGPTITAASEPQKAERLPTPLPRPALDARLGPPASGYDVDGPATTGAVPRAPRSPARGDTAALPAIKAEPSPKVEAAPKAEAAAKAEAAPGVETPDDHRAKDASSAETEPKPVEAAAAPRTEVQPARTVRVVSTAPTDTPAVKPAATVPASAIDLGGFRTLASLRRAWSDTAGRNAELAKALEPLARLRETDTGMEARLLAGPFADPTEAAKACLRLKAGGAPCAVTTYSGQPIGGLR
ncbi:SPOR domain-containing protein [Pinisolibacter sp.]|uniref:SPOR domain-containing protein n=1 Tax=Pinisolibacter sp. TaxID=2172024 RepID=UPI002FDD8F25